MPNHCINELIFRGVGAEDQARILAASVAADGEVDFQVLVPRPLNMWWGNVSQVHEKTFKRTGLDWTVENWGTKWNAYDHHPIERTDDTLTLRFQTAWRPPYPWLAALFNTVQLSFEHNWLSEGGAPATQGLFDMSEAETIMGPRWSEKPADEALHRHLHKLLWGVEEFEEDAA